ncbi:GMC family oxidoreductase [Aspergillus brunneoviolaceus CBS 621.78]|uniref:Alcohol oxidase n=1 Tax=Aspergillus brunneoviolaceus CBS 621.78 TaxID=1450534 RepID=A0ACD1FW28_9EURO|nr:alcohol oxidase [Aspergillus brunneoviolaceus CBS 621.78]RAH41184.1 alcohol oxidase [Aspergillus brunneoviolaceus CBS 621.78]
MTAAKSYDYVVVGAGTSGLVLASRLTEDADVNVLLIEAGANRMGDPRIETPGFLSTLYGNPDFDWDYMSEPQVHVNNRQIAQPRGRVVGGTSAMNFSVVMYPSESNFAAWKSLGNEGWGPEDMAPYLRKFHTYTPPSEATSTLLSLERYMSPENQGTSGPVPITLPDVYGPFNQAWDEAFARLGWRTDADPIAGRKIGAFTAPLTVDGKTGQRGYAAAYYSPEVAQRPNLDLLTNTMVERVLLTEVEGEVVATGVQVRAKDGERQEIPAAREVILCAGSMNTPQLLELSGIGQRELLEKHDIPVILDRPGVGENLQDHCLASINFEVADDQVSGDIMRDPNVVQSLIQLYEQTRGGPLSGMPISMAYLPLVDHDGQLSREKVHELLDQHLGQQAADLSPALQKQFALQRELLQAGHNASSQYMLMPIQTHMLPGATTLADVLAKSLPGNYLTVMVLHNHPFSRGSVHIRSGNVEDKPVFDPNYLSHPLDLEILARHVQFLDQIVATEPLASMLKPQSRIPQGVVDYSDLEKTKEVVKERLYTCFHPAGTCAMMPAELGGVVDSQLKVHGTRNLRVVDASIFPLEPAGNIQATVYAVAERAADLIRTH